MTMQPTQPVQPAQPAADLSASERKALLDRTHTIAMVGASADPNRPSYFVATYLCSAATTYDVWFVNPTGGQILGRPVYRSLEELPAPPDMVDVFRKSEDCSTVAADAVRIGAKSLWLQLRVCSAEARQIASAGGLAYVEDRCVKIEHARFAGGLHLAGFDTGVLSAKRGEPRR